MSNTDPKDCKKDDTIDTIATDQNARAHETVPQSSLLWGGEASRYAFQHSTVQYKWTLPHHSQNRLSGSEVFSSWKVATARSRIVLQIEGKRYVLTGSGGNQYLVPKFGCFCMVLVPWGMEGDNSGC